MTRITGIVAALATTAAVLTASAAQADTARTGVPAPTSARAVATVSELPREIPRGVALTLADADTFRVWASKDFTVVWGKRRDAVTGAWGARQAILKERNLFCGDIEARTAAGAVAVTAACDRFNYAEDQAPASSRALWSSDTLSWTSFKLPGEAYEEPGISPDGANAVWPLHQGYVVRTPAGFSHHHLVAKRQEFGSTAVVDDSGQVSLLYTPPEGPSRCGLISLTPSADGTVDRQYVALPSVCGDVNLVNLDVNNVQIGRTTRVEDIAVVQRTDPASRWAVTRLAPSLAPGLVLHATTGGRTRILAATGLPLLAVGSGNNRRWTAQTYDDTAQRWNSPTTAFRSRRPCQWAHLEVGRPTDVALDRIRCGRSRRLLVTTDAATWQTPLVGKHPPGMSLTRNWVSASNASGTTVYSRDRGAVSLPLPVTGACDVVVPTGPDTAVRVTTGRRDNGWPTLVQRSTPGGWSTVGRMSTRLRGTCRHAELDEHEGAARYWLQGTRGISARLTWARRGGELVPQLRHGL